MQPQLRPMQQHSRSQRYWVASTAAEASTAACTCSSSLSHSTTSSDQPWSPTHPALLRASLRQHSLPLLLLLLLLCLAMQPFPLAAGQFVQSSTQPPSPAVAGTYLPPISYPQDTPYLPGYNFGCVEASDPTPIWTPGDCRSFYDCHIGAGAKRPCPEGLWAGPGQCNAPLRVNCTAEGTNLVYLNYKSTGAPYVSSTSPTESLIVDDASGGTVDASIGPAYSTNVIVEVLDSYLFFADIGRYALAPGSTDGNLVYQLVQPITGMQLKVWAYGMLGVMLQVQVLNTSIIAPNTAGVMMNMSKSANLYFDNQPNQYKWQLHHRLIQFQEPITQITIIYNVFQNASNQPWRLQIGELSFAVVPSIPNGTLNATANNLTTPTGCPKLYYRVSQGPPTVCANGAADEYQFGLCFQKCLPGYASDGTVCWQQCAAGYRDVGLMCASPPDYVAANTTSCPWHNPCGLNNWAGYGCSNNCDAAAGYQWEGCYCVKPDRSYYKDSYYRGLGRPLACVDKTAGQWSGECYAACKAGYTAELEPGFQQPTFAYRCVLTSAANCTAASTQGR